MYPCSAFWNRLFLRSVTRIYAYPPPPSTNRPSTIGWTYAQRPRKFGNWGGGAYSFYSYSASLISFQIDYFYDVWTQIYEYVLPQLLIVRNPWYVLWRLLYRSGNIVAKTLCFLALVHFAKNIIAERTFTSQEAKMFPNKLKNILVAQAMFLYFS